MRSPHLSYANNARTGALCSFLFSLSAQAADTPYCVPSNQIRATVELCEENDNFVDAADACLDKFAREVSETQRILGIAFSSTGSQSASAQSAKLANSSGDLGDTDQKLQKLVADAESARRNMVSYLPALVYPGDPSADMLGSYGLAAFLGEIWCFKDNRLSLLKRVAEMDKRLADLRKTIAQTETLLKRTNSYEAHLGATSGGTQRALSSKAATGAPTGVPVGRAANPSSTITGEIHPEKRAP